MAARVVSLATHWSQAMIQSILDNDLYKFTMQQAVHRLYPHAMAEYEFTNRDKTLFPRGFANEVEQQIHKMAVLALTKDEKRWLGQTCPYLTKEYLDLLSTHGYDPDGSGNGVLRWAVHSPGFTS